MTAVSAIVVTYRGAGLLRPCLLSLETALERLAEPHELLVVENGSNDGSSELVEREFPAVRLLALPRNIGFSGGVAEALEHSSGRWILLLNNDATIEPGAVEAMLAAGERDMRIGSVAAQMRFARRPDRINSAGIEVDELGVASDRLLGRPVTHSEAVPTEVFGASGGAALLRRAMLDDVGGFDRSLFAFLEDADVAWRARMRGWGAVYAPEAVVVHHHSATARHGSDFKHYLVGRNRVRLLAKNASGEQLRRHGAPIVVHDLAHVAYVGLRDHTLAPLRGRLRGLLEWRRYRAVGRPGRREHCLSPAAGMATALARGRAWSGLSYRPAPAPAPAPAIVCAAPASGVAPTATVSAARNGVAPTATVSTARNGVAPTATVSTAPANGAGSPPSPSRPDPPAEPEEYAMREEPVSNAHEDRSSEFDDLDCGTHLPATPNHSPEDPVPGEGPSTPRGHPVLERAERGLKQISRAAVARWHRHRAVSPAPGSRPTVEPPEALAALWRRSRLIALATLAAAAAALLLSLLQTPQYEAHADLLFRDAQSDQGLLGDPFVQGARDPTRDAATNTGLVQIDQITARVKRRTRSPLTVEELGDNVEVTPQGQSDLVTITARDSSPRGAARLATTFARETVAFRRSADRAELGRAERVLAARIERMTSSERRSARGRELEARASQLETARSLQTGNAELVGPARVPTEAVSPRPIRNVLVGALLGLFAGLGGALLAERLDRRFHSSDEVVEAWGLPLLGEVPEVPTLAAPGLGSVRSTLRSPDGEAFQAIRSNLQYLHPGPPKRRLLIASVGALEGKTTVAVHLAAAMAASSPETSVLLVEADLRMPGFSESPGGDPGLSEVLAGRAEWRELVRSVDLGTNPDGKPYRLDVLHSGGISPNPAELLESPRMSELLETFEAEYAHVVIDSAPLGLVADTTHLLNHVSAAIVVARLGHSARDTGRATAEQLRRLEAPLLGVVVNGVPERRGGYYGYYGYRAARGELSSAVGSRRTDGRPAAETNAVSAPLPD